MKLYMCVLKDLNATYLQKQPMGLELRATDRKSDSAETTKRK